MDTTAQSLMLALALQYSLQSAAVRWCVGGRIGGSAYVVLENLVKLAICWAQLPAGTVSGIDLWESAKLAGLPAGVYALAGVLKVRGYNTCDTVTFNVINQLKILFSALFAWAIFGQTQTAVQVAALSLATGAALLVSPSRDAARGSSFASGTLPVLLAALCSGLAGQLCQYALQGRDRGAVLYSLELALWGTLCLLPTLRGADVACLPGAVLRQPAVLVPMVMQALAGVGVGMLIKSAGAIMMGLSTVLGLCLSVGVDAVLEGRPPPLTHLLTLPLVCASIVVYADPSVLSVGVGIADAWMRGDAEEL